MTRTAYVAGTLPSSIKRSSSDIVDSSRAVTLDSETLKIRKDEGNNATENEKGSGCPEPFAANLAKLTSERSSQR